MTAPHFEATDAYDLLTLVADEHRVPGADAVQAFLDACRRDAMAHNGIVSVNRVRALLADQGIEHHRFSAFWAHFTGKGRPMVKATEADVQPPWEVCEGSGSGNNGKPYRLRKWVGAGTPCDCGSQQLPLGALSVYLDGVEHTDTACVGVGS